MRTNMPKTAHVYFPSVEVPYKGLSSASRFTHLLSIQYCGTSYNQVIIILIASRMFLYLYDREPHVPLQYSS